MFLKRRRAKKEAQKRDAADAAWESKLNAADLTRDLLDRLEPYEGADLSRGLLDRDVLERIRPYGRPQRNA